MGEWDLASMFLLGLAGCPHCVGMCGPLVLALPGASGRLGAHLLYHLGRLLTYAAVGASLGGLGAPAQRIAALEVIASVGAAALLAALGLMRLGILREPAWLSLGDPRRLPGFRRVADSGLVQGRPWAFALLGMLLGLLPCGLSYGAFVRALPSGGFWRGGLLMAAFGLGTLPGLLLIGTGAAGLLRRHRRQADLVSGVLLLGMAASLLVKALA